MNLKRIARKLKKMDDRACSIALEELHSILTINQWNKMYMYLMMEVWDVRFY